MAYVYRHIRLDKNEPFYIGIGGDATFKRAKEKARRSDMWKRIVAKGGYSVEILFDGLSWEGAKAKEIELIALYGRKDLLSGTLCNMTDGGDGVMNQVFSESHRKKLSDTAKARIVSDSQKEKLRNYRLGVKNSPEARLKISNAIKGKPLDEKRKAALKLRVGENNPMFGRLGENCKNFKGFIVAYKDGSIHGRYEGIRDCAEQLSITATKISAVIHGRRNKTGGYTFKREI